MSLPPEIINSDSDTDRELGAYKSPHVAVFSTRIGLLRADKRCVVAFELSIGPISRRAELEYTVVPNPQDVTSKVPPL